jgi:cob(I)alamin adenosyltransferase
MITSIATKRGDGGQTSLAGGTRVSKGHLWVEAYDTIDELNSAMGFARSICENPEVHEIVKAIQRELFRVGSAVATAPESPKKPPPITPEMVEALTAELHRIEAIEGLLSDWSLPSASGLVRVRCGAHRLPACRKRHLVRLAESGEDVSPPVLAYLNRLSDLLWLFGRFVEARAGVDASLRDEAHKGNRWSRTW